MTTTTTKRAIIFDDCPMHINYKNDIKRFLDMIPLKASADIIVNKDSKELLYPTFKMIFYLEEHETFYEEVQFIENINKYYEGELEFQYFDKVVNDKIVNIKLIKQNEYFVIFLNDTENSRFLNYYTALEHIKHSVGYF